MTFHNAILVLNSGPGFRFASDCLMLNGIIKVPTYILSRTRILITWEFSRLIVGGLVDLSLR